MTTSTAPATALVAITIDTADAEKAAHFYGGLTGGEVSGVYPEYGYAQVTADGSTYNFQSVAEFQAPTWPSQERPQQFHLDFRVTDLDAAVTAATKLGAREADPQPAPDAYRVMLDLDGHPFCLCPPSQ